MNKLLLAVSLLVAATGLLAQNTVNPRPITLEEYQKAKTFVINDLDKDTYVKFESAYVLDRYEARKPYFITGDDGQRKRIDLYQLIARQDMQQLGLVIFYTSEKNKRYQAVMPNFTADGKVWEQFFEDIHAIDKEEKNFVLKLSYVLSKEFAFQQFKAINGGKVLDEHATYGNDICFPGDQLVTIAGGVEKHIRDIKAGDEVITLDEVTHQPVAVKVRELVTHEEKNYAITRLVLIAATERDNMNGKEVHLTNRVLEATPNHPVTTGSGIRKAGEVSEGEQIFCLNESTGAYEPFTLLFKTEQAQGSQRVYNIIAEEGSTFLVNGVVVRQK